MKPRLALVPLALGTLLAFADRPAQADVKPHALFSDNMVLQRGKEAPVWGTADDGEKVTVEIDMKAIKETKETTAKDGKWMVKLSALQAGGPYTLTIKGKNTVTIKNVLVGEVWICSGQSNMEMSVNSMPMPRRTSPSRRTR